MKLLRTRKTLLSDPIFEVELTTQEVTDLHLLCMSGDSDLPYRDPAARVAAKRALRAGLLALLSYEPEGGWL